MNETSASPSLRHRVLVIDPLPVILRGVRSYLERSHEIEVVGTAQTFDEALPVVRQGHYDVVVLDPELALRPDQDSTDIERGIQIIHEIHTQDARIPIIVLVANQSLRVMRRVLAAGVSGYLFKCEDLDNLCNVVDDLRQERVQSYFSPKALGAVATSISRKESNEGAASSLTPREKEILQLVVEGKDSKGIASALGISIRTVYTHRSRILHKAKARSFYELVDHARALD